MERYDATPARTVRIDDPGDRGPDDLEDPAATPAARTRAYCEAAPSGPSSAIPRVAPFNPDDLADAPAVLSLDDGWALDPAIMQLLRLTRLRGVTVVAYL